jgi:hypothetical protein
MEIATVAERFVKVDLDRDECDAIAELAENAEALARIRNWDTATQQKKRVVMNRVRYKMNISASLFAHGAVVADANSVQVAKELPPWLKSSKH